MANIFERITENRIANILWRLEKGKDDKGGSVFPESIQKNFIDSIELLRSNPVEYWGKTKGLPEYGQLEVTGETVKTGRGGRKYVQFNTAEGLINWFPNAQYGPFMAKNKTKEELTNGK